MKIITWNVNGIRAVYKKGFMDFIERENPDILCLQETKAHPEQVETPLLTPHSRTSYWSSAKKAGYSGTATFTKNAPAQILNGIGIEHYDSEGRFVITRHEGFLLFNIYFPNGGSGEERHGFKQKFLYDLNAHLKTLINKGESIVVVGDYNVAYLDYDVHDPARLSKVSGFLPEEREWFRQFLDLGFVDTYRHFYPDKHEAYTWWDYRTRARLGNKGWRIDHICVTNDLKSRLKSARILDGQQGSDHCPVEVVLS